MDPGEGTPEGNMTAEDYEAAMNLPQDGAWMDNIGVAELPKDCKALGDNINIGEKCPILADAVGQMAGEIEDALFTQNTFINTETDRCTATRDALNDEIASDSFTLGQQNVELARATKSLQENENELMMRVEEFNGLRDDLIARMTKCNGDLKQLFEEMCGLITIRDELYKMSGVHPYLQDCAVGDWSPDECTVTCGGGVQMFSRKITQEQYFGSPCPPLTKEGQCNMEPCPIDCIYSSDWSQWSACSSDCGGGVRWRHRKIAVEANACGKIAPGNDKEFEACNQVSCRAPVDCQWTTWAHWSDCSCPCDGVKHRSREIGRHGEGGGKWCDDDKYFWVQGESIAAAALLLCDVFGG